MHKGRTLKPKQNSAIIHFILILSLKSVHIKMSSMKRAGEARSDDDDEGFMNQLWVESLFLWQRGFDFDLMCTLLLEI